MGRDVSGIAFASLLIGTRLLVRRGINTSRPRLIRLDRERALSEHFIVHRRPVLSFHRVQVHCIVVNAVGTII